MTLDEAIKQLLNEAEKWDSLVNGAYKLQDRDCAERAADHRQLAEWLKELKELKAADVKSASVIKELQEHIKQRILETAFNNGGIYGEVAEDIADRIDIWVDEFGRTNND